MGSPVAFGGLIAMTSEDGETFMLKAGPTHEIVRTNTIDEPVYSSPAIANGRIYIRERSTSSRSAGVLEGPEGTSLNPGASPLGFRHALARRFDGALRSRGSLARLARILE